MGSLEGKVLGNCRVLRHIGGGGMGDVYLAEQLSLGREVVVKVVRGFQGAQNTNPDALHQFAQEARAIAALDHPHILPLHDYGEQDGLDYLIMPYVPDGSLGDAIAPGELHRFTLPLEPALVASLIGQTAEALQYAHDKGVVHRDVKPGNILIRVLSDSRPVTSFASPVGMPSATANVTPERIHVLLADFGLARFLRDMAHITGTTGTPLYSAPEQYQGRPEPATDQYSLACVAYFLLTGQLVFDGAIHELHHLHLTAQPLPPTRVNPALPPAVDTVLLRALAKEPAQRYPQVLDFARALSATVTPGQSYSRPLWAQAPQAGPAGQAALAPTPNPPSAQSPQPQAPTPYPYQPVQSMPPLPAPQQALQGATQAGQAPTPNPYAPPYQQPYQQQTPAAYYQPPTPSAQTIGATPGATPGPAYALPPTPAPPYLAPSYTPSAASGVPGAGASYGSYGTYGTYGPATGTGAPAMPMPSAQPNVAQSRILVGTAAPEAAPAPRGPLSDAPGAPIPKRYRLEGRWRRLSKQQRYLLIGGLIAVLVVACSGGGFATWRAIFPPPVPDPQVAQVQQSGSVTVSSLATLPITGGQTVPQTTLPMRPPWSDADAGKVLKAADTTQGLTPAYFAPSPQGGGLPSSGFTSKVRSGLGLGESDLGVTTPENVSVASTDEVILQAVDGALLIDVLQPQPNVYRIADNVFFKPVLRSGDTLGQPRVLFDSVLQRWVFVVNEISGGTDGVSAGYLDVAISQGADPTAGWRLSRFSTAMTGVQGFSGCSWGDYPQLGGDYTSYYITTNEFTCGANPTFQGATLWDLPKITFTRGAASTLYRFTGFDDADNKPIFTVTPAQGGYDHTTQWLVGNDAGLVINGHTSQRIYIWAVNDSATDLSAKPVIKGVGQTMHYTYATPPTAPQAGGSSVSRLNTGDARIAQVIYANGHLYGVFTTAVNWFHDTAIRAGLYWFEADVSVTTPTTTPTAAATPQGAKTPTSAANGQNSGYMVSVKITQTGVYGYRGGYVFYPSLTVTPAGDMLLFAQASDQNTVPGLILTGHLANDGVNTMGQRLRAAYLTNAGNASYTGQYWGDYTAAVSLATPTQGTSATTAWLTGAYVDQYPQLQWRTTLAQISIAH